MKTYFAYLLLLLVMLFTACSEKDYYDSNSQEIPKELADWAVPSGFDWTTSSHIALNIEVDDQYNGAYYYKVQVFDNNPIISDASLLAEGLAKKNEPFKANVAYSKSDSILYIQQTDPQGYRSVKAIYVSDNTKAANISTLKSGETKSANLTYTAPTRTYATPSSGAITLTGNATYNTTYNATYVIPAGQTFEGTLSNGSYYNVSVYVEGTWKNPASSTSLNNMKLIIQNGGKYMPTQTTSSMLVNGSAKIVVAATGEFNPEKKTINVEMNNESPQIVNNSTVFYINNMSNIKEIFNYGTMTVSGTISSNTSGVQVVNESSLTAQSLSFNGVNIINTCKFIVNGTAALQSATVNIASEKLFKASILELNANNTINLDSRAILDVTTELKFNNTVNVIKGPDSGDRALLRLEKFSLVHGWEAPQFLKYLQIESSNYPSSTSAAPYTIGSEVQFVRKGESTVNIPSTDCNAGGNVITPSTPTPTTYPVDVTLGDTYTYAFEDSYPKIGDYDMNDLVLDVNLGYTLSASNKASKLNIKAKVRAIGATRRLAAAIQLDGILHGNVTSVTATGTYFKGGVFSITNGLENGQNYAVLPITDDAHGLFGSDAAQFINTKTDKAYLPAKEIVFSITFNNPIDISSISLIDMLNIFIINGGYTASNRQEVHLRNYSPTAKSTDLSAGGNYSSSDFVYAIRTPKSVKYPIEWTQISSAYPRFKTWVSSNGATNPNWYNTYEANKIYSLEK